MEDLETLSREKDKLQEDRHHVERKYDTVNKQAEKEIVSRWKLGFLYIVFYFSFVIVKSRCIINSFILYLQYIICWMCLICLICGYV